VKSLEILVEHWSHQDLAALPPYGESVVRSTFLELGIEPPRDLVQLYGAIGGMEIPDKHLWRLWPLSEVLKRQGEANEYGVLFSDYLLDSWAYRAKPIDKVRTAVFLDHFDDRQPWLVAETLEEFFDKYLHDADELLNEPKE